MRSALWALLAVLVMASASCGGGTDDSKGNPMAGTTAGGAGQGGEGGVAGNNTGCGDRRVDAMSNEQCEPMVPHNLSCEALGMGRGLIACSSTCKLMMMCLPEEPMGGSDGSSGLAGTGG